ncbi:DUF1152 domain-containing protein [Streptomyces sp. SID3343]|uniref:DUF1152 domain-containing protein n=1 Tax=Streptomyces sp. SID3343 TaxID=2690260 RepID=UPI00136EC363|nr:DUF1152 domain-containing protein [Streptomyces sp. SID3343]
MRDRTAADPPEARDLYIAAGGGGDPVGTTITASALAPRAGAAGRPLIATYAWDRPDVDPTSGPLGAGDFTGPTSADPRYGDALPLTPATLPLPPAGSTLPRLAADLPARLLLLDPCGGLRAMAAQIRRITDATGAGHVRLVDVGGDILAHGDEETLSSPLADALALAACALAGVDTTVYIAGPGTDCEIPQRVLMDRLGDARHLTPTVRDAATAAGALAWYPSEASALFAAAVHGVRGTACTVQRRIPITDASARVYHLDLDRALAHNTVARRLLDARPQTLDEAADLAARLTGIHELERRRRPAAGHVAATAHPTEPPSTAATALTAIRARAPEATHVTYPFAARALGLDRHHIPALRALLGADTPVLSLA